VRFALFRRVQADPAYLDVSHGDQVFRVTLKRRSATRRMTLRVSSATGAVVLTVPEQVDVAAAHRFADAHGGWIAIRLARIPARVPFVTGAEIPLRGIPHRILQVPQGGAASARVDPSGEPAIVISAEASQVARRVRAFLTHEAKHDLVAAVGRHTNALGTPARSITVRDTRSRWGSCSARGSLNFSWRLILAPPFVLDYLAAHEVAHLKEMNHSPRFWRLAHSLCPYVEEAERWLKRNGADLHRYG
jgi:predicted metal-dependent hydrolase